MECCALGETEATNNVALMNTNEPPFSCFSIFSVYIWKYIQLNREISSDDFSSLTVVFIYTLEDAKLKIPTLKPYDQKCMTDSFSSKKHQSKSVCDFTTSTSPLKAAPYHPKVFFHRLLKLKLYTFTKEKKSICLQINGNEWESPSYWSMSLKSHLLGLSLQDLKDSQVWWDWLQLGLICISNAIRHLIDLILTCDHSPNTQTQIKLFYLSGSCVNYGMLSFSIKLCLQYCTISLGCEGILYVIVCVKSSFYIWVCMYKSRCVRM